MSITDNGLVQLTNGALSVDRLVISGLSTLPGYFELNDLPAATAFNAGTIVVKEFGQFFTNRPGAIDANWEVNGFVDFSFPNVDTSSEDFVIMPGRSLSMTGGFISTQTFRIDSGASADVTDTTDDAIFSVVGVEVAGTLHMDHGQVTATNFTVTSSGRLEIGLGGLTVYQDFVGIDMTGNATLAGTLELSLIDSFIPTIGDSFDILTYSLLVGAFETVTGMDLGNGSYFALIYGANVLTIQVQLDGDLNGDGFVGVDDLNLVLVNWNQTVPTGSPLDGDISGDGFVGVDDLNLVLVNWNNGTPPGAGQGVSIPEPGTLGLVAIGLGILYRRPRRSGGRAKHSVRRSRTMSGRTRRLAAAVLALLLGASPAMSAVWFDLVPVDNSALLTGYATYDLLATTDTDWTAAVMLFEPSAGSIYQHVPGVDGVANPAILPYLYPGEPAIVFDTYYIGSGAGGAGDLDRNTMAYAFDTNRLGAAWFNTDRTDIGATTIGRLTLTDDTAGTMSLMLTSGEDPALFDVTFAPGLAPVVSLVIQEQAVQEDNSYLWVSPSLESVESVDDISRLSTYLQFSLWTQNTTYDERRASFTYPGGRWSYYNYTTTVDTRTGDNLISALPEPGAVVMLGLGGLALLRRVRAG